ncbi:hypothetical protein G6F22_021501 [Rhizopus arrhizus]|nr:hypothetical protein G6F22_021501 [Rhizopus arrhizus]
MGSGSILREVEAAAELLQQDFGIASDVWSATSLTELRRDGLAAERWNLLHPAAEPRVPSVPSSMTAVSLHWAPTASAAPTRVNHCARSSRWIATSSCWRP